MNGASAMASEPRYISLVAVADGQRRAAAGGDQQVVLPLEQEGEREGAAQLLRVPRDGQFGSAPRSSSLVNQRATDFGVGLRLGR